MTSYRTKEKILPGENTARVKRQAITIFKEIKKKTKRKPYIKSAYFKKEKIFFDYFWQHLNQKNIKDKRRRLKFFQCALDLIQNSRHKPVSIQNRNKKNEILHRFSGTTINNEKFYVQIKENKKTKSKYFMSCFGAK